MKKIVLFILCCFCAAVNAQQFETGVIIDSIPVANSTNETFTLYLPKTYKPNELSPILFIFSPSGNGKSGVEAFIKAAEAYNHILVCSNNSRNGSVERNFAIAQRLFTHAFSNFNILKNRTYLAGFSGGSRLVTAIATVSSEIEGVIACGAGFLSNPSYMPSTQKFSYAGLCGDRDMNYREMIGVKGYLDHSKFSNTFFSFEGDHKWPPNEQLLMAFDWLEIEALKKGHLKKPNTEIKTGYLKNFARAKTETENNRPLIAAAHYERVIDTYGSFFNVDSVHQTLQYFKKSKDYTRVFKSREKAFEKETLLTSFFLNRFEKDNESPEKANFKWWEKEFEKLNKLDAKANTQMINMHARLRFRIFVAAYLKTNRDASKSNQEQQNFCKSLVSLLSSK